MQPNVRGNCGDRVVTRPVSQRNRIIAIVLFGEIDQYACTFLCKGAPLRARNFGRREAIVDQRLILLHKGFRAEINLRLPSIPNARQAIGVMQEGNEFFDGTRTLYGKLPKNEIGLQPIRLWCASAATLSPAPAYRLVATAHDNAPDFRRPDSR